MKEAGCKQNPKRCFHGCTMNSTVIIPDGRVGWMEAKKPCKGINKLQVSFKVKIPESALWGVKISEWNHQIKLPRNMGLIGMSWYYELEPVLKYMLKSLPFSPIYSNVRTGYNLVHPIPPLISEATPIRCSPQPLSSNCPDQRPTITTALSPVVNYYCLMIFQ